MKIEVDAIDNISGIAEITVHYVGKDINENIIDYWNLYPQYNEKTKKYESTVDFDHYYPSAVYSIIKIELTDGAGNKKVYGHILMHMKARLNIIQLN